MLGSGAVTRSLLGVVVMAVLFGSGCATQGDLRTLRQDLAAINSAVAVLQVQQMSGGDLDNLRREAKTLSAEVAALEMALRDTRSDLLKLRSRVDDAERAMRETSSALDALNEKVGKLTSAATPPPAVTAPLPSPPASAARAPLARAAPALSAEQAYAAALATFRAREHGQAVLDFLDFLAKYRRHPLAPNAQYWIGEAYYVQRDFRQAIVEFQKVLEFGLTNPKVPDALLKVGLCYRSLRDSARFQQVLARVIREYPKSNAAKTARELVRTAQAR